MLTAGGYTGEADAAAIDAGVAFPSLACLVRDGDDFTLEVYVAFPARALGRIIIVLVCFVGKLVAWRWWRKKRRCRGVAGWGEGSPGGGRLAILVR